MPQDAAAALSSRSWLAKGVWAESARSMSLTSQRADRCATAKRSGSSRAASGAARGPSPRAQLLPQGPEVVDNAGGLLRRRAGTDRPAIARDGQGLDAVEQGRKMGFRLVGPDCTVQGAGLVPGLGSVDIHREAMMAAAR
jgi:hypothetical protein